MLLQLLPNETLLQILHSLQSVQDVLSLTLTCHRLHDLLSRPAQRLPILFSAASHQLSPLPAAIRLITHNSSQPAHLPRPGPPHSLSLLRQLLHIGSIANSWADLYPSIHWHFDSLAASRRLLTESERHRVRQACYRYWLYSVAYHNASYTRYQRLQPPIVRSRAALLRGWSSRDLADLLDFQSVLRALLEMYVCPSNGTVIRRHKERYGDNTMPVVNHLSGYGPQSKHYNFHHLNNGRTVRLQSEESCQGWGDDVSHYYVIEDMLKLHPGQIMQLYNFVVNGSGKLGALEAGPMGGNHKAAVETFVVGLGEWFDNNGETLGETVRLVLNERGEDTFDGVGSIVAEGED
ncbi:MAG: hypothetical protein Q9220_002981 [cf. Caloplaca sp. 1 TL-2023]